MGGGTIINEDIVIDYTKSDKDDCLHIITHIDLKRNQNNTLTDYVSPNARRILTSKFNAWYLKTYYGFHRCDGCRINSKIKVDFRGRHYIIYFLDSKYSIGSISVLIWGAFGTCLYAGNLNYYHNFLSSPVLSDIVNKKKLLNIIYLDGVYYEQQSEFRNIDENIEEIAELIRSSPTKGIYLCAEKFTMDPVVADLASRLKEKVYIEANRYENMKQIGYENFFTSDKSLSRIYVAKGYIQKRSSPDMVIILQRHEEQKLQFEKPCYNNSKNMFTFHFYSHINHRDCCKIINILKPEKIVPINHQCTIDKSRVKFTSSLDTLGKREWVSKITGKNSNTISNEDQSSLNGLHNKSKSFKMLQKSRCLQNMDSSLFLEKNKPILVLKKKGATGEEIGLNMIDYTQASSDFSNVFKMKKKNNEAMETKPNYICSDSQGDKYNLTQKFIGAYTLSKTKNNRQFFKNAEKNLVSSKEKIGGQVIVQSEIHNELQDLKLPPSKECKPILMSSDIEKEKHNLVPKVHTTRSLYNSVNNAQKFRNTEVFDKNKAPFNETSDQETVKFESFYQVEEKLKFSESKDFIPILKLPDYPEEKKNIATNALSTCFLSETKTEAQIVKTTDPFQNNAVIPYEKMVLETKKSATPDQLQQFTSNKEIKPIVKFSDNQKKEHYLVPKVIAACSMSNIIDDDLNFKKTENLKKNRSISAERIEPEMLKSKTLDQLQEKLLTASRYLNPDLKLSNNEENNTNLVPKVHLALSLPKITDNSQIVKNTEASKKYAATSDKKDTYQGVKPDFSNQFNKKFTKHTGNKEVNSNKTSSDNQQDKGLLTKLSSTCSLTKQIDNTQIINENILKKNRIFNEKISSNSELLAYKKLGPIKNPHVNVKEEHNLKSKTPLTCSLFPKTSDTSPISDLRATNTFVLIPLDLKFNAEVNQFQPITHSSYERSNLTNVEIVSTQGKSSSNSFREHCPLEFAKKSTVNREYIRPSRIDSSIRKDLVKTNIKVLPKLDGNKSTVINKFAVNSTTEDNSLVNKKFNENTVLTNIPVYSHGDLTVIDAIPQKSSSDPGLVKKRLIVPRKIQVSVLAKNNPSSVDSFSSTPLTKKGNVDFIIKVNQSQDNRKNINYNDAALNIQIKEHVINRDVNITPNEMCGKVTNTFLNGMSVSVQSNIHNTCNSITYKNYNSEEEKYRENMNSNKSYHNVDYTSVCNQDIINKNNAPNFSGSSNILVPRNIVGKNHDHDKDSYQMVPEKCTSGNEDLSTGILTNLNSKSCIMKYSRNTSRNTKTDEKPNISSGRKRKWVSLGNRFSKRLRKNVPATVQTDLGIPNEMCTKQFPSSHSLRTSRELSDNYLCNKYKTIPCSIALYRSDVTRYYFYSQYHNTYLIKFQGFRKSDMKPHRCRVTKYLKIYRKLLKIDKVS